MCVSVWVGDVCGMWQSQRPRLPHLARHAEANDKCTFCIPNATCSFQQVAACNWQPTYCDLQLATGNLQTSAESIVSVWWPHTALHSFRR